jgi:hypothetical protein
VHKIVAAIIGTAVALTAFSVPADAAKKAMKTYPAKQVTRGATGASLDGRVTGRPRTCGFDYYEYDGRGVPMGPYCH